MTDTKENKTLEERTKSAEIGIIPHWLRNVNGRVVSIYEESLKESKYCLEGLAENLKVLQEMSGVPIPETTVQAAYARWISDIVGSRGYSKAPGIRAVMEVTGYKPEVAAEVVQQGYQQIVRRMPYYEEDKWNQDWNDLQELTGIEASEEVVQEGYLMVINNGLRDEPMAAYGSVLLQNYGKAFRWLRERTNVPLGSKVEERLQEIYLKFIDDSAGRINPFDDSIYTQLRLIKNTGVAPNDETLQRIYRLFFDDEQEGLLPSFVDATGVPFSSISEELVQKRYQKRLDAGDCGFLKYIPALVKATGIRPNFPESKVIELAKKLLEDGRPDEYQLLKEITGMELPESEKRKAFVHGLFHRRPWRNY